MAKILIIYSGHDINGSTANLAGMIAHGVENNCCTAIVKRAQEVTAQDFIGADGYILGSGDYNGNPEPEMIAFFDQVLGAGKVGKIDLSRKPFSVFSTSAGYSTGSQYVLNAMARSMMTFGAIFVGGGNWHTSQGLSGMVATIPNKPGSWCWYDPTGMQKHLYEDACALGGRVSEMAKTLLSAKPTSPQCVKNSCSMANGC